MTKFIFFTGGVASSIGKGVAAATLGAVLEARGLKTSIVKLDPYINVDPGTMSPHQHGEVFVTQDGAETDLDLGHYERFLNKRMSRLNNCTTGQIYDRVIKRERAGGYLGATVQVIPHITDEIKTFIKKAAQKFDIVIVEVGGTVGDIESLPFLEAIRQMRLDLPANSSFFVHMTLVPQVSAAGELKTKPTQHSVRELREIGIQPDVLLCRSPNLLPKSHLKKIALFANLHDEKVFSIPDVEIIYDLPLLFNQLGIDKAICNYLKIKAKKADLSAWKSFSKNAKATKKEVRIGLVGKYKNPNQSYRSLIEALEHAGIHTGNKVSIVSLDADEVLQNKSKFNYINAILIPGAFGERGIDGKISAIKLARELKKPFLGICIGMQLAIVEFARNQLNIKDAHSAEFKPKTKNPVICLEKNQVQANGNYGGTMRLGSSACTIVNNSKLKSIYKKNIIHERHRHRYEFNNKYKKRFAKSQLQISAWSEDNKYCEAIELTDHPWFIATQFHPEYESNPMKSHPLFKSFIKAASQDNN